MPFQITELNFSGVINYICELVAFPVSADPAGSIDPKHGQMRAAVNNALVELLSLHNWQDLTLPGSIPVVADFAGQKEKSFPLPVDFFRFIDRTQWGSQSRLPAMGPISPQAWQMYQIIGTTPMMTLFWQIRNDKLFVQAPPFPTPVDFNFYYISRGQVRDADDATTLKNVATKNGDTFMLDGLTITLLARKKWLEWNNFDSTAATQDFNTVYNSRVGNDAGAPTLSLNSGLSLPLIQPYLNTPDTGFAL